LWGSISFTAFFIPLDPTRTTNGIFPLLAVETFSPNCNTKRKHTVIREVDRNLSKKAFSKKLAILVSVFLLFGIGFAHASAVSDVTTYRGGIIL
jgi:hypothetical protein